MPIYTGFVKQVYPGAKGRFEILLQSGPLVYTFDQARAALCERAATVNRVVTISTQDTQFGEKVVNVELVEAVA